MSIYTKIHAVMQETKALEKDLTVGYGPNSYKAVGEAEVLNMVKPLFVKHGLIIFPTEGEIKDVVDVYNKTDSKGNVAESQRAITQLKVYFKIVDIETGESETIVGFGNGADTQDKGSGKAFTYAFKTALSKTFMLFSSEDTDNTHSDDIYGTSKINNSKEISTKPKPTTDNHICRACGGKVTDAELKYSLSKYGKPLCKACQQKG